MTAGQPHRPGQPGQSSVEQHLDLLASAAVVIDDIEDIDVAAEIGGPMDDLSTMIGHIRAADAVLAVSSRGLHRAVREVLAADESPSRRTRRIVDTTACGAETVETLAVMDLDDYLRLIAKDSLSAHLSWLHTGAGLAAERLRAALYGHGQETRGTTPPTSTSTSGTSGTAPAGVPSSVDTVLTVPAAWSGDTTR